MDSGKEISSLVDKRINVYSHNTDLLLLKPTSSFKYQKIS